MAITCTTVALTRNTPAATSSTASHQIEGRFQGNTGIPTIVDKWNDYGVTVVTENQVSAGSSVAENQTWFKTVTGLLADENYLFRALVTSQEGQANGATLAAKTAAMVAAADPPTYSAVTATTVTLACDYTPRVLRSTCSAQLQFKKYTAVDWENAGAAQTTGGYSEIPISRDISGLDSEMEYNVRLVVTRTTANDTTLTSSTVSFTTLAAPPVDPPDEGDEDEDGGGGDVGGAPPPNTAPPPGFITNWTPFEVNLGVAAREGVFSIGDPAIEAGSQVLVIQAAGPYTGKGTLADEAMMDQVVCLVGLVPGEATVYWKALDNQRVMGNFKFTYLVV